MGFSGAVSHQIDDKNRIRIPSKFRKELGDEYVFVAGEAPCIFVYSKKMFEEMFEPNITMNPFTSDKMTMMNARLVRRGVEEPTEDGQGRVMLSPALRARLKAGDDREVMTVGWGSYLEIWNPTVFNAYLNGKVEEDELTQAYRALGKAQREQ